MLARKMIVHWWEDFCFRKTCHRNDGGTAEESFLGEVNGNHSDGFRYRLKDSDAWVGPFSTADKAMRAFEHAVEGRTLTTMD